MKWAWSEVQMAQLTVAACIRVQLQNMKDKSRGATQTCTAKSNRRSLRSGCAGIVKVSEFSSQIPLLQTTGRNKLQCRGTIRNVFEVQTKAFRKLPLTFLKNSLFLLKVYIPLLTFLYLRLLTLSLHQAVRCPLYNYHFGC